MNDFQKSQSNKILSCYSENSLDLIKGRGTVTPIGQLSKNGKDIKTANGWVPVKKHSGHVGSEEVKKEETKQVEKNEDSSSVEHLSSFLSNFRSSVDEVNNLLDFVKNKDYDELVKNKDKLESLRDKIYDKIKNSFHHTTAINGDPNIIANIQIWSSFGNLDETNKEKFKKRIDKIKTKFDETKAQTKWATEALLRSYEKDPNWQTPT
jgi:hypothetical protein